MKKIKDQHGFSLVEVALIIVVILMLAGVGIYLYYINKEKLPEPTSNTSQTSETSKDTVSSKTEQEATTPEKTVSPTADWITYKDPSLLYEFKHPKSWVFADNPDACSEGLVLFAASSSAVGKCASEFGGQMMISAQKGGTLESYKLTPASYPDLKTKNVTIDGASGVLQTGTYKSSGSEFDGIGGTTDGDKQTIYIVKKGDYVYLAQYNDPAGSTYVDVMDDFTLLVEKTLTLKD